MHTCICNLDCFGSQYLCMHLAGPANSIHMFECGPCSRSGETPLLVIWSPVSPVAPCNFFHLIAFSQLPVFTDTTNCYAIFSIKWLRSFLPKFLLHSSVLIFIRILFQILGPLYLIVFWLNCVVPISVARLWDCLVLCVCISSFSVNKLLNICVVLLFLCLWTNLLTLIFSIVYTLEVSAPPPTNGSKCPPPTHSD